MNYIQTHSGARISLPDCDPKQIVIDDIAHALSHACRFAGHTEVHWSVAAHSLCVAEIVPDELKLQALLHDAPEAYLCDIPTPFKVLLPEYGKLEAALWSTIAERFHLDETLHKDVRHADSVMLMTERDALCTSDRDWGEYLEGQKRRFDIMDKYLGHSPRVIKQLFLARFREYCGT